MDAFSLLGLAMALAMDAFAVALAAGAVLCPLTFRPCFRLAFHFGLFQAMMPVIGWSAGQTLQAFTVAWSHWVAFGLLLFIGVRMIREAITAGGDTKEQRDPSRGTTMVMLSVATSIDALAVGLSLAMLKVTIWFPALVIGLVACGFTVVGLCFGTRVGQRWGKQAEVTGGAILIGIGVKILVCALFFDSSAGGSL